MDLISRRVVRQMYKWKGDKIMHNNELTIELALELYRRGTSTVLHGGKVYFRKEKSR